MKKIFVLLAVAAIGASFTSPSEGVAASEGRAAAAPAAGAAAPATAAAAAAAPARAAVANAPFIEQILENVNQFRADNGKPPLTMNPDMVETAGIHSQAMAKGTVAFGHDNFDLRFKYVSAKLGGIDAFAENVAMGKMDARQVVDGWAHSPGHRKNMLGNYNLTGIATATAADGTIYFTQIFAHKQ
jgi:uncharacterized protein YkwD